VAKRLCNEIHYKSEWAPAKGKTNSGILETNPMTDNSKGCRALANSERNLVPGASRLGPASPGEKLTVNVRLRKRSDGPALPDMNALAATSYRQRKHMSREEFAASYGAAGRCRTDEITPLWMF
jgi:hypothetical protein